MSQRWVDMSGSEGEGAASSDSDAQHKNSHHQKKPEPAKQTKDTKPQSPQKDLQQPELKLKKSSKSYKDIPIEQIHTIESDYVWLQVNIYTKEKEVQMELKNRVYDLVKQDEKIRVFYTRKPETFHDRNYLDLNVSKEMALKFLNEGFIGEDRIKFRLHQRNFQKREYREDRDNRQYDRDQKRRGRGRNDRRPARNYQQDRQDHYSPRDRNQQRKKPVYVDKQTGLKSDNKKQYQKRIVQEGNRQYSKKRAEQIGDSFASFRNKKSQTEKKQQNEDRSQHEKQATTKSTTQQRPQNLTKKASWKKKQNQPAEIVQKIQEAPKTSQPVLQTKYSNKNNYKNNYQKNSDNRREYRSPKNNYNKKKFVAKEEPIPQKKSTIKDQNTFQGLIDDDSDNQ